MLRLYNIKKCKSAQYLLWNDVNTQKYIETLNAKLLPIMKSFFLNKIYIFQNDNAPCHRVKTIERWMKKQRVPTLNWPARSPDLNPINKLWSKMAKSLLK